MMSKLRKRLNNSGVSLIEFIIAFTLLAVLVLPITTLFLSAAALNQKARDALDYSSIARQIRSEVLEAYKTNSNLCKFDPINNTTTSKTISITTAALNVTIKDVGVIHLGYDRLYPDIKYNITSVAGIFVDTNLNNDTTEVIFRVDIYKRINDGTVIVANQKYSLVQTFYIMIPKEYNLNKRG